MDLQTFTLIYDDLFNHVQNQEVGVWVKALTNPLTFNFSSQKFIISKELQVDFTKKTLPREFYQCLLNVIETNLMRDVIMENEKLLFTKFKDKSNIFDQRCTVKTYMLKWMVDKFGTSVHDKVIEFYDTCQDESIKAELRVILHRFLTLPVLNTETVILN